jgi:Secretion system C-terminal sorting domain
MNRIVTCIILILSSHILAAQYFNNVYNDASALAEISSNVIVLENGNYLVPSSNIHQGGETYNWRIISPEGIEIGFITILDTTVITYLGQRGSFIKTQPSGYAVKSQPEGTGIMKLTDEGAIEWTVAIDTLTVGATTIVQLDNGNYLFTGQVFGDTTCTLLWCNQEGIIIRDTIINIPQDHYYFGLSNSSELENGDLLFGGWLYDPQFLIDDQGFEFTGHNLDQLMVRIDSLGNIIWSHSWDNEYQDGIISWVETNSDGIVVATTNDIVWYEQNDDHDPYIAQMGTMLVNINTGDTSEVKYVGDLLLSSYSIDIVDTPDGGYAILGMALTYNSYLQYSFIMKLDSERELDWYKTYNYEDISVDSSYIAFTYDIAVTPDSGFIVVGERRDTWTDGNNKQMPWIFKTDQCGELEWNNCGSIGVVENKLPFSDFLIAPNPASNIVNISSTQEFKNITIRDITGKVVFASNWNYQVMQTEVDTSMLAKGIYLVQVAFANGLVSTQRLVVE